MEISYDLVRKVLIAANDFYLTGLPMQAAFAPKYFPNLDIRTLNDHIKFLAERGLIVNNNRNITAINELTPDHGFDFLKTIKDDAVWEKVKERLDPIDECSLRIVEEAAHDIYKEMKIK